MQKNTPASYPISGALKKSNPVARSVSLKYNEPPAHLIRAILDYSRASFIRRSTLVDQYLLVMN
ncbi:MAG: hypothetical protein HYY40_04455 [Bacteroidetes bacterium]|nr:hypothetical protein [Bacteroidota bacterium]